MTATIATTLVVGALALQVHAQDTSAQYSPTASPPWRSDRVVYVAGLADVRPNSSGSLSLTQNTVVFANKEVDGVIALDRITTVSIGDERVATGGYVGKAARLIPIYGIGSAMGAVTNKSIDLLTIEYLDQNDGYHGAVFEVPKTQAVVAQQQIESRTVASPVIKSHPCNGPVTPNTVLVEPIATSGVDLPAEYRVLLYEQLIEQLRVSNGTGTVYRTGDAVAPCAVRKLQLTVIAFKKGNEAIRASTGPVGFFVGATSVGFHLSIVDNGGVVLFEKSLKVSKHGDGDSLSVTRNLAKSVSKRLVKAEKSDTYSTLRQ